MIKITCSCGTTIETTDLNFIVDWEDRHEDCMLLEPVVVTMGHDSVKVAEDYFNDVNDEEARVRSEEEYLPDELSPEDLAKELEPEFKHDVIACYRCDVHPCECGDDA